MMHTKRNMLLLVLTAMIWGVAFVFQSTGGDAIGPYSFCCLRFLIGGIALLPAIRLLDRMGLTERRPQSKADRKQLIIGGVLCGLCLTATSVFQQLGLYLGTSPGKAGFITACYIILVPLLGIFLKKRCGWNVWLAVAITIFGLYLLCMKGSLRFELSDLMILICSLACALHILVIDHFGPKVEVVRMSCIQFFTASVLSVLPMIFLDIRGQGAARWFAALTSPTAWTALLYAGLLSSAVGYTLQCVGQQDVNPTAASLLMSLESVFSVLASWVLLGQLLTLRELLGCALIFTAVVFAQLPAEKLNSLLPGRKS